MNEAVLTTIVIAFFGFLLVSVVTVTAFFVSRWVKGLDSALQANTKALTTLNQKLVMMMRDIEDHARAIEHLQGRSCGHADCPYFDPDKTPIPRLARTRLTDGPDSGQSEVAR